MDAPPTAARIQIEIEIECAAIRRRRSGHSGAVFAVVLLMLYVTLGCSLMREALPHQDGALRDVSEALEGTAQIAFVIVTILLFVGVVRFVWSHRTFAPPGVIRVSEAGLALDRGHASEHIDPEDARAGEYDAEKGELVLRLANGEIVATGIARDEADAVLSALAIKARREITVEALGASYLDRGERSFTEWRASLRALITRPSGGYRQSALDPDHLASVLWSRDLAPERRLGAALALAATDDPAARQRVRVVIDTCADEALRSAVERAAEGELDDAELGRALERINRA
jgi:hypothetical protein